MTSSTICGRLGYSFLITLATSASAKAADGPASHGQPAPVQVQMRNVALHIDERAVLDVRRLRGELVRTNPQEPATFDKKGSFNVRIDSAEIAVTTDSLSRLLNDHVFAYEGAPLRNVRVATAGKQLQIKGTARKGIAVPFSISAEPRVDREGNLRLHAASIKALGIPAKGLLSFFGLGLDKLVNVEKGRGVQAEGDELVLELGRLMPPPRIEGHLQTVRVEEGRIVQTFGPGHAPPLTPPDSKAPNYMYYQGGILRFGKITMDGADLQLIDDHPEDVFDFFQDHYNDQLVAGYSKNTPEHALKVYMVDYHRVRR